MLTYERCTRIGALATLVICTAGFGITFGMRLMAARCHDEEARNERPQTALVDAVRVAVHVADVGDQAPQDFEPSDL